MKTIVILSVLFWFPLQVIGWLNDVDTSLLVGVNSQHTPYLDTFMWLCSRKWEWIPFYVSILYVVFRNFSYREALYCLIAVAVVILFTDAFAAQIIRPSVGRMRPSNPDNPISEMIHIVGNHRGGRFGFPSTHASNTWGLAFFIAWLFRRHWLTLFLSLWAVLVCYSRLYLGVHYPGDLLAGMLLGFLGATIVYWVFVRITGHQTLTDVVHPYLPVIVGLLTIAVFLVLPFFFMVT